LRGPWGSNGKPTRAQNGARRPRPGWRDSSNGCKDGDSSALVRVDVRRPQRIEHPRSVRRDLWISDVLYGGEILEGHRTLDTSLRGKIGGQQSGRHHQQAGFHSCSLVKGFVSVALLL